MKNTKEHKVQILAAIALAFALGVVAPAATFAIDGVVEDEAAQLDENGDTGADDGIVAQSSEDGDISLYSSDEYTSAVQLVDAWSTAKNDPQYGKYQTLYQAQQALAKDLTAATDEQVAAAANAVLAIDETAKVRNLDATHVNAYILAMHNYTIVSNMFKNIDLMTEKTNNANPSSNLIATSMTITEIRNAYSAVMAFNNRIGSVAQNIVALIGRIKNGEGEFKAYNVAYNLVVATETLANPANVTEANLTSARNTLISQMQALAPTVPVSADMSDAQLIEAAKQLPPAGSYAKYAALYHAVDALTTKLGVNSLNDVTEDAVTKLSVAEQNQFYNSIAAAAVAVNSGALEGLIPGTLPDTSVPDSENPGTKPGAPDTGIVGLFESGAIDAATMVMIIAAAVAALAGAGIVAKLYLKHKF